MTNQRLTAETAPPAPPNAMIIFGAGGDLTKRKLIPALFHFFHGGLLPHSFPVVGLDRLDMDDAAYRDMMAQEVRGRQRQSSKTPPRKRSTPICCCCASSPTKGFR